MNTKLWWLTGTMVSALSCGGEPSPSPVVLDGGVACTSEQTNCSNRCVDTSNDSANCGACGRACPSGSACVGGECSAAPIECTAGQTLCAAGCANTNSDPANCGACGVACPSGQLCASGRCTTVCGTGLTNCGGGCVSTASDVQNCGACGNACSARPHTAPTCVRGQCGTSCLGGYGDCDNNSANGCEVDLRSSAANCGACGRPCGANTQCVSGVCAPFPSCRELFAARPSLTEIGAYTIQPAGSTPFQAVCRPGGFTLALAARGDRPTFRYDSPLWTNDALLGEGGLAEFQMGRELKHRSYMTVPFSELFLAMYHGGMWRTSTIRVGRTFTSLRSAVMQGMSFPTERALWTRLLASSTWLQPYCNRAGFSTMISGAGARVRIGLVANNEHNCDTPDTWIGIGGENVFCPSSQAVVGGGGGGPCSTMFATERANAEVWVR